MEIKQLRKEIDKIDNAIVDLLEKRKKTVKKIASIKRKLNMPVIDEQREKNVVERLKRLSKEKGLDENFIACIYEEIIKNSRDEQNNS